MDTVLITGVSGLLGTALAKTFSESGYQVIGQYHRNRPEKRPNCHWIYADFSSHEALDQFIRQSHDSLASCAVLVHNYGPISYQAATDLSHWEIEADYFGNVIVPFRINRQLLNQKPLLLKSVVHIGFELAGQFRAVQNVLSYLMAKNALLQYTLSMDASYPDIRFNIISFPSLIGAEFPSKKGGQIPPAIVASEILKLAESRSGGEHRMLPAQ